MSEFSSEVTYFTPPKIIRKSGFLMISGGMKVNYFI